MLNNLYNINAHNLGWFKMQDDFSALSNPNPFYMELKSHPASPPTLHFKLTSQPFFVISWSHYIAASFSLISFCGILTI